MDVKEEIARQVDRLPPDMRDQVLQFVTSLAASARGPNGATLRQFASSLDTISAQQMMQAIEEECGRLRGSALE
jgi:hypothetical protein